MHDSPPYDGNLPCQTIVVRLVRRRGWIVAEVPQLAAFLPREDGKDDDGLSVSIVSRTNLLQDAEEASRALNKSHGCLSLHVGRVRDCHESIDVKEAPLESNVKHAVIVGIPNPSVNRELAEFIAGNLARQ